jgi:hypothetical protein
MLEAFDVLLTVTMAGLMLAYLWKDSAARRAARRRKPIRAPVVYVTREQTDARGNPWVVTTHYEVPGVGIRKHRRRFEEEGKALLWQRLHREGSEHDVIPHPKDREAAFLPDDLDRTEWGFVAIGAILAGIAAWEVFRLSRDYFLDE